MRFIENSDAFKASIKMFVMLLNALSDMVKKARFVGWNDTAVKEVFIKFRKERQKMRAKAQECQRGWWFWWGRKKVYSRVTTAKMSTLLKSSIFRVFGEVSCSSHLFAQVNIPHCVAEESRHGDTTVAAGHSKDAMGLPLLKCPPKVTVELV